LPHCELLRPLRMLRTLIQISQGWRQLTTCALFLIFSHLLHNWGLHWIIILGLRKIRIHLTHHLLLRILLLHLIRILTITVVGILIHVVGILAELLWRLNISALILRELELATGIPWRHGLQSRDRIIHRRHEGRCECCIVIVTTSDLLHQIPLSCAHIVESMRHCVI
jgi:hypothetical protein